MILNKPTLIFINGVSSAGKSTLAKAIQDSMEEPYLKVGIDAFMEMLPKRYLEEPEGLQLVSTKDETGRPLVNTVFGPVAEKLITGFRDCIVALADGGNNLVMEVHISRKDDLTNLVQTFQHYHAYLVCVYAPLRVLEGREIWRRKLGMARGRYDLIYGLNQDYDLIVDSSELTIGQELNLVKEMLKKEPRAFREIAARLYRT